MRIKSVHLERFKRFTDLTVQDIPETARLIILAGPNGSGKSSFFEALNTWVRRHQHHMAWEEDYHVKSPELGSIGYNKAIQIQFHEEMPTTAERLRKAVYVRTAYRNDPEFKVGSIGSVGSATEEVRFQRMIENDQAVGSNYQRLVSQALQDAFELGEASKTLAQFRDEVIGEISSAVARLFPDLKMKSLGNPLSDGTFRFDKGESKGFLFKNLSGGEKAAFDIILDLLVKMREFDDSIFCIDEPEAHMNTRLQGKLLDEMFKVTTNSHQLWLATHSMGMMRRARDIGESRPGEVVFLNFGERDYDEVQVITPETPTRHFWEHVLDVALDDMAALIAPSEVILCEGNPLGAGGVHDAIDAQCYETIFSDSKPDTRFISVGNAQAVESDRLALISTLNALVKGTTVRRLVDRDDLSDTEVVDRASQGIAVLGRRNIEAYLFDDEVIEKLCEDCGLSEKKAEAMQLKVGAVEASKQRGNPDDDVKSAAGEIYTGLKKLLGLKQGGNTTKTFMRDTLAPRMQGTAAYSELEACIFGLPDLPAES